MDFIQLESSSQVQDFGDFVRWIKCIFKDCAQEDARKDHESAEKQRQEKRKKKEEQEEVERKKNEEAEAKRKQLEEQKK